MSANYSIERDLKEISKMGEVLRDYVLSDSLYMSIEGGMFGNRNLPQLTFGAFLMRLRRLNYFRDQMTDEQKATLDKAIAQHDDIQSEWAVHYNQKMVQEALSRLRTMEEFFRECQDSVRNCASAYPVEAQRRTIVQELLTVLTDTDIDSREVITKAHNTDGELRRWLTAGEFIWSDELAPVYPRAKFWWLYGKPESNE